MKKIILIDAYAIYYRSYYAFLQNPLKNKKGEETSVIFGFFNQIYDLIKKYSFDYFLIVGESKSLTFRHKIYTQYKANRPSTPESLKNQILFIESVLDKLGIPYFFLDGYEADDVIAKMTEFIELQYDDFYVDIVSPDKDLMQLVSHRTNVLKADKKLGNFKRMDKEGVFEKWLVRSDQIVDFLSLVGDSSDNIPGVRKIGAKTAIKLLSEYKNLEIIYESLHKIEPATRKKLMEDKENAFLSKQLASFPSDKIKLPDLVNCQFKPINTKDALPILQEKEIYSIIKKFFIDNTRIDLSLDQRIKNTHQISNDDKKKEIENNPLKYKRISYDFLKDSGEIEKLVKILQKQNLLVFDLETTSLDPFAANIVAIVFVLPNVKKSYYIQIITREYNREVQFLNWFKIIFLSHSIKKIGHNLKFEYAILKEKGIILTNLYHDTMLTDYLIDSNQTSYKLESLIFDYFKIEKPTYKEIMKDFKSILELEADVLKEYTFQDGEYTSEIYLKQIEFLKKEETIQKLLIEIELPIVSILAKMESNGVLIDESYLSKLSNELSDELKTIEKQIYDLAGEVFNINSTKELQTILFSKLGIKPIKKNKTGYSTDINVLEKLLHEHDIARLLLRYRILTKLKNTYIDVLPKLINAKTTRIHTSYNQSVAATGRLSSTHPNLQNIPIKMKEGRRIRNAFIAPRGFKLVSFDYSQVELRILAFLSKDKELLSIYQNKEDVHQKTASILFHIPSGEKVTEEQRRIGKTINFSVIYGISAFSLSNDLKVSQTEAKLFIDNYFNAYPGVQKYINDVLSLTRDKKYVSTYYGRKRFILDIESENKTLYQRAARIAFNTVIQGTASDIIKIAMIQIENAMNENQIQGQMIMQVHDELVFYLPEKSIDYCIEKIIEKMKNIEPFSQLLEIDYKIGDSW